MGVWQSLEIPGHGRLTVRDSVEASSVDAPGGVFDDAIEFEFASSSRMAPDFQVHFLQFAAHEVRVHGERGDFSAHGDPTLSDAVRPSWRVDTLPPQGAGSDAVAIRICATTRVRCITTRPRFRMARPTTTPPPRPFPPTPVGTACRTTRSKEFS